MSRRHIHYQDELTVALFAVMFVVVLLIFLASIPLINSWFPRN